MVTCNYCEKELNRNVFCSAAHKMAFRRRQIISDTVKYIKMDHYIIPKDKNGVSNFNPIPKPGKKK